MQLAGITGCNQLGDILPRPWQVILVLEGLKGAGSPCESGVYCVYYFEANCSCIRYVQASLVEEMACISSTPVAAVKASILCLQKFAQQLHQAL